MFKIFLYLSIGFPGDVLVKNPPANAGGTRATGSITGLRRFLGVGMVNPSNILLGKFHRQRGLVGYNPWFKESDVTS